MIEGKNKKQKIDGFADLCKQNVAHMKKTMKLDCENSSKVKFFRKGGLQMSPIRPKAKSTFR